MTGHIYTGGRCYFCGHAPDVIGHDIVASRGGYDEQLNRIPICDNCVVRKRDLTIDEFRWWLLRRGVTPSDGKSSRRDWMHVTERHHGLSYFDDLRGF